MRSREMGEEHSFVLNVVRDSWFRVVLSVCTIALYANTFRAGYVWDDRAAILSNKDVTQQRPVMEVFRHDFWGQVITDDLSHKSYRPVTVLSFRLNHMLHGLHASGYHIANVVIYAISVLLVYELGLRLMSRGAARFSSLLFCFHPVHVEAVASLVGRADSLCGVFYFGAILAYIPCLYDDSGRSPLTIDDSVPFDVDVNKRRRSGGTKVYFIVAIVLGIAAGFTKEIGVTVFGVIPCLEVCAQINVHRRESIKRSKSKQRSSSGFGHGFMVCLKGVYSAFLKPSNAIFRTVIVLVILVILMRIRVYVNGETKVFEWTILENHIMHLPTRKERFLSYAQTHFWYFFKLCFPRYLCFDYGFACIPTIHEFSDFRNAFAMLAYGVLLAIAAYAIKHVHVPMITAMVLLIVPLLPALNIFLSVGTVLAERLLFLPSAGFSFLVGQVIVDEYQHLWLSPPPSPSPSKNDDVEGKTKRTDVSSPRSIGRQLSTRGLASLHGILALVCMLSTVRVVTRNTDWNSELAIYGSALSVCPLSAKALANYAVLSTRGTTIHKAMISVLSATDVYKGQAPAFLNTGVGLKELGLLARSVWYFERAGMRRGGHIGKTYAYLGSALYEWSLRYPFHIATMSETSLRTQSDATGVLRNMAMRAMDQAFRNNFALPSLLHARGSLALEIGDFPRAAECFKSALQKTQAARAAAADVPREDLVDEVLTYNQLGNTYSSMKEYDSAIGAFEMGIEFAMTRSKSNSSIIAYNSILVNFGSVLRAARRPLEAQQHLLQGIEWLKGAGTEPSPALYNNLGLVEQDMGNLDSAERYFTIAVENNRRDRESSQESAYMMRVGEKGGGVDAVEEILKSNLQKIKQRKSDNNLLS